MRIDDKSVYFLLSYFGVRVGDEKKRKKFISDLKFIDDEHPYAHANILHLIDLMKRKGWKFTG